MAPPSIYKFPRTPHVLNLGAATRDDLILDAKDALAFINSPFLIVGKHACTGLHALAHGTIPLRIVCDPVQ